MTQQEKFFFSLEDHNINVPGDRKDALYKHLKDSGRILRIKKYFKDYEAAKKVEITKSYKLTSTYYRDQDSSELGFLEGIGEMTGFTSLGRSVNQGLGEIASTNFGITETIKKGLRRISGNVIGEDNTNIIANKISVNCRAFKSSFSKCFLRGSYDVSRCKKELRDDIASVSPGCFKDVTVPKLVWIRTYDQKDKKPPKELQIIESLRIFYSTHKGATSVKDFEIFHKQQKLGNRGCLGNIRYFCKSWFAGKSTANQGSSGAGKFSSCWVFFASPEKNKEQVPTNSSSRSVTSSRQGSPVDRKTKQKCVASRFRTKHVNKMHQKINFNQAINAKKAFKKKKFNNNIKK